MKRQILLFTIFLVSFLFLHNFKAQAQTLVHLSEMKESPATQQLANQIVHSDELSEALMVWVYQTWNNFFKQV